MSTIDITPVFNESRLRAYAEKHQTRDPQSHIAGRLEVLSELAKIADDFEHDGSNEDVRLLLHAIKTRHRQTSETFMSFFGG